MFSPFLVPGPNILDNISSRFLIPSSFIFSTVFGSFSSVSAKSFVDQLHPPVLKSGCPHMVYLYSPFSKYIFFSYTFLPQLGQYLPVGVYPSLLAIISVESELFIFAVFSGAFSAYSFQLYPATIFRELFSVFIISYTFSTLRSLKNGESSVSAFFIILSMLDCLFSSFIPI